MNVWMISKWWHNSFVRSISTLSTRSYGVIFQQTIIVFSLKISDKDVIKPMCMMKSFLSPSFFIFGSWFCFRHQVRLWSLLWLIHQMQLIPIPRPGNTHDPIFGTFRPLVYRQSRNSRQNSVGILSVLAKIQTWNLPNISQKCHRLR
jgi:hypothetical protein